MIDSCTMKKNEISSDETSTGSSTRARSSSSPSGSPSKSKRKSTSLPPSTVEYLKAWMMSPEHIAHPYPTEQEKAKIMEDTGIELKQLTNWFVNNRKRYWKPRVEARLQEQAQAQATAAAVAFPIKHSTLPVTAGTPTLANVVSSSNFGALLEKSAQSSRRRLVSPLGSPARAVSEQSSCVSDSGSVGSMTDQDDFSAAQTSASEEMTVTRTEVVDVHILKPSTGLEPSLEDVTILPDIPRERILKTFENADLQYRVSADTVNDKKKIQTRRDAEIVRMKKAYLKEFLSESTKRRRSEEKDEEEITTPRPKFRRVSIDLWKEACLRAENGFYDRALPSLEEAAQLFGYAS